MQSFGVHVLVGDELKPLTVGLTLPEATDEARRAKNLAPQALVCVTVERDGSYKKIVEIADE